jgi:hypothetical protein
VLDRPVQAALDDLEAAFDYCLYGLQAHALVFSLWPAMRATYEQLFSLVDAWPGERTATHSGLRDRLARSVHYLQAEAPLPVEAYCAARERVYADMYAHCAHVLGAPAAEATLAACLAPRWTAQQAEATERLRGVLRHRLCPRGAADGPALASVVTVVMEYLRQEQARVRAVGTIQQRINRLLGRPTPRQPLTAGAFHLFYQLQDVQNRQPYLVEDLDEVLGLRLVVTPDTIEVAERTTC